MANIALSGANPSYFTNVNDQGYPILNQGELDKVLSKLKTDSLSSGQYRSNWNKFGWNVRSDGSFVKRGPAIVGLSMGTIGVPGMSGSQSTPGIVKAGTNAAPTTKDYQKAAKEVGLDYNSYIRPTAFVPAPSGPYTQAEKATAKNSKQYTDPVTGQSYLARIDNKGNFVKSFDSKALFNDVSNKTQGLYLVGNVLDRTGIGANKASPHAAVLFKSDGSGNLVPVTKEDGSIAATPYKAVAVTHAGWRGQLAELAPIIGIAGLAFGMPYLSKLVGAGTAAGTAAGAGAGAGVGAGTLGLGTGAGLSTGTMAGTMLSGTGATLGSTAALGAGSLAALNNVSGALPSGTTTLPSGTNTLPAGKGGLPGVVCSGTGTMSGQTLGTNGQVLGNTAELAGGFTGVQSGVNPETGLPHNPDAPGYKIDPEGPAKIGNQCAAFSSSPSVLDTAKKVVDTAKDAKDLFEAGKSLFGSNQPAQSGSEGGGGTTGFLDSTPEFLNKSRVSGRTAGLKTVNKEAEENVSPLDFDESENRSAQPVNQENNPSGYAEAGSVTTERNNQGYLTDAIKEWNAAFCDKKYKPKFVYCDLPEFLFSRKSLESHKLKPIKQGLRVNPLATGGLPHKYAAAAPKGHKPEFITGMTGYYACGGGTGQSDDIPAMLHDGDYVMDAETVSALGDGSSKAGHKVLEGFRQQIPHKKEGGSSNPVPAKIADGEYVFPEAFVTALGGGDNKRGAEILDGLRTKLRAHKRGAPLDKIPPKAKDPIQYIKTGSK
jgi:hypothetical protein